MKISEYRKEEMLISELHKVREELKKSKQTYERAKQAARQTEETQKEAKRVQMEITKTQAVANKIMMDVKAMHERLLDFELEQKIPYVKMDDEDKVA